MNSRKAILVIKEPNTVSMLNIQGKQFKITKYRSVQLYYYIFNMPHDYEGVLQIGKDGWWFYSKLSAGLSIKIEGPNKAKEAKVVILNYLLDLMGNAS